MKNFIVAVFLGGAFLGAACSAASQTQARPVTEPVATSSAEATPTAVPDTPPPESITATEQAIPSGPQIAGCPVFPADNIWNARADTLPVDPNSDRYVQALGSDTGVHPDFGSGLWEGGPIGIPFDVVPGTQTKVGISFYYGDESDPGPYPLPPNAQIEGGPDSDGDRHVLVVDQDSCTLYEVYDAHPNPDGTWDAGSGAVFGLNSNALRPETWTSADAAGLSILAGLVRYDEIEAGQISHALRFTASAIRDQHIWPARHHASCGDYGEDDTSVPPMGQRFRLKASFDVSPFPHDVQIILTALKEYGMILADCGSDWYLSGAPDSRWNNEELVDSLRSVTGSDFEAVDVSGLMSDPDSGAVR